jgi:hypothetical protein
MYSTPPDEIWTTSSTDLRMLLADLILQVDDEIYQSRHPANREDAKSCHEVAVSTWLAQEAD